MYDTLKTDLQIQNWAGASLLLKPSFSSCFQIQWDKQNRHLEEQLSEHRYQVNARHQLRRRREKHSTTSFNLHFFRALAGFLCAYQQNRAQSRLLNLLIINCLIRRLTIWRNRLEICRSLTLVLIRRSRILDPNSRRVNPNLEVLRKQRKVKIRQSKN